eukprot:scaffold11420_cov50-Cyclotella_meneghiniana.AAC.2
MLPRLMIIIPLHQKIVVLPPPTPHTWLSNILMLLRGIERCGEVGGGRNIPLMHKQDTINGVGRGES